MNDLMTSRQEVGLVPAKPNSARFGKVGCITGHYFGADLMIRSEGDLKAIYRQIQYNDMVAKGYSDIMYSIGLNPFRPKPIELRGTKVRGAANGTALANTVSPSVLVPVGPTLSGVVHIPGWQENLLEGARIADDIIEYTFGGYLPWVGHRYWKPTGCPGTWFMNMITGQFDEQNRPLPPPVLHFTPDPDLTKRPYVGYFFLQRDPEDDGYVHWVQDFLNRTSPEGCPVDGIWGPISDDRVRKFQGYFQAQGFPCRVSGIVDLDTWATIHYIATVEGIV